jgi:hypothetical protein
VKNVLSVDEYGLLNFFGTVPAQRDDNVPSAYEVTNGDAQVSFALTPAARDVRVLLRVSGIPMYELNAMGVEDVKLHNDKGCESLEAIVSERQSIWLRTSPAVSINESITDPT